MVALHWIIHEKSSPLGSLFGLDMVSHVSTHLLLTALQLNNCWHQPQSKCNSLTLTMPCNHVHMTCSVATQQFKVQHYPKAHTVHIQTHTIYPAHHVQMFCLDRLITWHTIFKLCCNVIHATCSPSQLCCSTQVPYQMKPFLRLKCDYVVYIGK
jgi:hypothetical protein